MIGVLLVNLGTPDSPDRAAIRRYLKEFLSDARVIEIPKIIWFFILYGYILPFRTIKTSQLYQSIWTAEGSPLRVNSEKLALKLQQSMGEHYKIILAMRYGNPSIESGLAYFKENNIDNIIILPLFPQYSAPTTASIFDKVNTILKTWRVYPHIKYIRDYYSNVYYIKALAKKIKASGADKILFSFHGLPQAFIDKGDIYCDQCHKTAELIARELHFSNDQYLVSFQSRLGRAEWLKPYTDKVISNWPAVICAGFAVDCLETLEEICERNKDIQYISALNDSQDHVAILKDIVLHHD